MHVTGSEKTDYFVNLFSTGLNANKVTKLGVCNKHTMMYYGILAGPHASFSSLLTLFGPCRRSSKDGKRSFVPFVIIVDGEIIIWSMCAGPHILCIVHVTSHCEQM